MRPRKTFELEFTRTQAELVLRALTWTQTLDKDLAIVRENTLRKVRKAYTAGNPEIVRVRLSEGQMKVVFRAVTEWRGGLPTTGAWRKVNEKVRKALDLWKPNENNL